MKIPFSLCAKEFLYGSDFVTCINITTLSTEMKGYIVHGDRYEVELPNCA